MNYPSSFSLRIIQLDANEEDIPLGFVPGTFDEQDPKFADNRSKHKNDPVTMKKLRDKAASKSKKSSSKASKKKFDDFGRSRLPKHSYKNIQPTTEEVSRLNLSFSEDFEIFDPITSASTSVARTLKGTTDEFQQRVGTIAEEFDDFCTISPRKILIKVGFASPVSPDQHLKRRKIVMFQQDSPAVMDDDTSGRNYPSAEKMAELVTLISKIPVEVVKALKNEENKQSQEEKIDEQQQSQEDGFKKQESSYKEDMHHEDYAKGSLNDIKESRDEESNKQHILEEQQLLDVNAADKEAGREDDLKNEDCSDLKTLEDVNTTAKEDGHEVDLKNQECTDMEDVHDEVGGTIIDSIQVAVDTILFGLSTPSTTKSLDVGASNKMTESQWDLPDCQIPPDFPDAQVRELEVSKAKTLAKKERKKSRILRSLYISKYGCGSKYVGDFDKEEKLKYAIDRDCGIFVCAYAEILSEGLQVHSCRFDVASQRARNASLQWHYGVEKTNEGYMSDNGDPPRPRKSRH
ncbi:hypothetical protein T459_21692 [Capsicum annuum]|uniref:Uncharacterized protein n=1 Tax=Capsicum annuum TaxID=4072 RepID=A0A2G2YXS5_CAPAN|nr:hypothetical protein T459_21692 [Capsicum annuum]